MQLKERLLKLSGSHLPHVSLDGSNVEMVRRRLRRKDATALPQGRLYELVSVGALPLRYTQL